LNSYLNLELTHCGDVGFCVLFCASRDGRNDGSSVLKLHRWMSKTAKYFKTKDKWRNYSGVQFLNRKTIAGISARRWPVITPQRLTFQTVIPQLAVERAP
jgi:hypothetical protein